MSTENQSYINESLSDNLPIACEAAEVQVSALTAVEKTALLNAVELWAEATTGADCFHRPTVLGAKRFAAVSFFRFAGKDIASVKVEDVRAWRTDMEALHKAATVYARLSRLTSFYEWVMGDAVLGEFIRTYAEG